MSTTILRKVDNMDMHNLQTEEGKDVKFFYECKITELYHKYYDYQDLYNAIDRLPLFRNKFDNYEKIIKDKDSAIKQLEDEINRLQSDVFRDRFDKYEKELKEKQDIIDNLNNEIIRLNLIVEVEKFINNN